MLLSNFVHIMVHALNKDTGIMLVQEWNHLNDLKILFKYAIQYTVALYDCYDQPF